MNRVLYRLLNSLCIFLPIVGVILYFVYRAKQHPQAPVFLVYSGLGVILWGLVWFEVI